MLFDISFGISLATWEMYIDLIEIIPAGTPLTKFDGTVTTSLGGINFFSINEGTNLYYLDDFSFTEPNILGYCSFPLGLEDDKKVEFSIYPNPATDALYLQSKQEMTSISICTILGQEIYSSKVDSLSYRVDVSNFSSGTYFIKVKVGDTTVTKRFIKE